MENLKKEISRIYRKCRKATVGCKLSAVKPDVLVEGAFVKVTFSAESALRVRLTYWSTGDGHVVFPSTSVNPGLASVSAELHGLIRPVVMEYFKTKVA